MWYEWFNLKKVSGRVTIKFTWSPPLLSSSVFLLPPSKTLLATTDSPPPFQSPLKTMWSLPESSPSPLPPPPVTNSDWSIASCHFGVDLIFAVFSMYTRFLVSVTNWSARNGCGAARCSPGGACAWTDELSVWGFSTYGHILFCHTY